MLSKTIHLYNDMIGYCMSGGIFCMKWHIAVITMGVQGPSRDQSGSNLNAKRMLSER